MSDLMFSVAFDVSIKILESYRPQISSLIYVEGIIITIIVIIIIVIGNDQEDISKLKKHLST